MGIHKQTLKTMGALLALTAGVAVYASAQAQETPPASGKPVEQSAPPAPNTAADPKSTDKQTAQPKVTTSSSAKDRMDLDSTSITGNRELPKVMYVVPWKKSGMGDLPGRPSNSLLDEVLAPVDREVFRRQTEYFTALEDHAQTSTSATPSTATPPTPKQ